MSQYDTLLTNQHIFNPVNTGSPRLDVYDHISRLPQTARIDFEEHTVAGDLIIRIEPDLGSAAEDETRILALPYALRFFGQIEDAKEFVRCVKLIAGDEARPFDLQIIAAHYYQQARTRPVAAVLKEMALLAMELTAVTATIEERLYDEPFETERLYDEPFETVPDAATLAPASGPTAFLARAAVVLGETEADETDLFAAECRSINRRCRAVAGLVYDEFAAHLATQEDECADLDEIDALYASFESVYEQYDEGHVITLTMNAGERVVVAGRLDDDLDETHLPVEARHLAAALYELYINGLPLQDAGPQANIAGVVVETHRRDPRTGEPYTAPMMVYGLDTWRDYALEAVYAERVTRTSRQLRCLPQPAAAPRTYTRPEVVFDGSNHTVRYVTQTVAATRLHEQIVVHEVCRYAAEREVTRTVLETLLARWQRDFHTRTLHRSPAYRALAHSLQTATDTAVIARLKQHAWQQKESRQLTLKQFTALMTQAETLQAALESQPWRVTCETAGVTRTYRPAQPLISRIPSLKGGTLGEFAVALQALPRQEQERVRVAFQTGNPTLYARVRDGLQTEIKRATAARLRYFRWACYGQNKPAHPFHTLTQADRAEAWELLKTLSAQPDRATWHETPAGSRSQQIPTTRPADHPQPAR